MSSWAELTYPEVEALDRGRALPILPLGAVEAHGPHLPLDTDNIISLAVARQAASLLEPVWQGLVLPPMAYAPAPFAAGFRGTISVRPETLRETVVDIGLDLKDQGFPGLVLVNSHFDPAHIGALYGAIERLHEFRVIFPDFTRRRLAERMSDEFRSGACHAGQYESSVVLAARPELVREAARQALEDNPASLSEAIRSGKASFVEAGGPQAYFGYPRRASAEEGRQTIELMASLVVEAVKEAFA
ncbi:MAG: creatininase family protein [Vulcanimicrobiota bacterium]